DRLPAAHPRAAPRAHRQQPAVVAGMARHAERPPPRAAAGQRSVPRIHRAARRLGRPRRLLSADVLSRPGRLARHRHRLVPRAVGANPTAPSTTGKLVITVIDAKTQTGSPNVTIDLTRVDSSAMTVTP